MRLGGFHQPPPWTLDLKAAHTPIAILLIKWMLARGSDCQTVARKRHCVSPDTRELTAGLGPPKAPRWRRLVGFSGPGYVLGGRGLYEISLERPPPQQCG